MVNVIVDTIYIESGFGKNYSILPHIVREKYNIINCYNPYGNREFLIQVTLGGLYNQRGRDNHTFQLIPIEDGFKTSLSNLYLNVLTDMSGNALFGDGKYLYFETNTMYNVKYMISAPLTANEVRKEIEKGNYTLYLCNGLTTYNINGNLYIPRYNSYVYVGTTNLNGAIINLESKYYRFKFKIIG